MRPSLCFRRRGSPDRVAFKAKSRDEDVDEDGEEDKDGGAVVHCVQLAVFPAVVQIVFHCGDDNKKQNKTNMKIKEKTRRQSFYRNLN